MDLTGKTALITGASGKVGRVLVPMLADQGVRCLCQFNRRGGFVEELAPHAAAIQADLAAPGGIEKLFREVDQLAHPEILIQLAGTFERVPLKDLTDEALRAQIEINLIAPIRIAREFARRTEGPGKIIHFTDIAASRPWAQYSVYCAAKAALTAFTQSLAKELAPRFQVNAVAPGTLEGGGMSPQQEQTEIRRIPAARLGTYEEAGQAVVFLLTNDYINGHVLTVDGGRSL